MTDPACTDCAYLEELKRGDATAFEQAVREHAGWMLAVSRRITNCDEDAADCVQEAFAITHQKIAAFEGRSTLKTWLHRVVVNQALMKLRKKRRRPEESIEDLMPGFDENGFLIGPVQITHETAEELLLKKEVKEKVVSAINELPETYRTILLLRDIEELSTAETAELLQIDDGAVRTRLHRARTALKKKIETVFDPKYLDDVL